MFRNIIIWAILILLPMVPVAFFYKTFEQQNYFDMQGFFKGVAATGPIAAYAFIVWLGLFIFQKISKHHMISSREAKKLTGKWMIESTSAHGSKVKGICYIRHKMGSIMINGTFEKEGKQVGHWNSIKTWLSENRLNVFYHWREIKGDEEHRFEGICWLIFGESPIKQMNGPWNVVGVAGATGTIIYTKVENGKKHFFKRMQSSLHNFITPRAE